MYRNLPLAVCLLFLSQLAHAQDLNQVLKTQGSPPKIPSDYNVQLANSGVGYSGALNYSLALFSNALENTPLGLNISYYTKGIKVSQEASDIGLGWTNNFVGTLSRTINGYDDFASVSGSLTNTLYFNNDISLVDTVPYPFYQMSYNMKYKSVAGTQRSVYNGGLTDYAATFPAYIPFIRFGGANSVYSGNLAFSTNGTNPASDALVLKDFEADQYAVNVPGFSSEFVIDKRGNVMEKVITGAKYTYQIISTPSGYGVNWRITAPTGVVYVFDKFDRKENHGDISKNNKAITTWYLAMIIDTKQDTIRYSYSQKTLSNVKNYTSQGESIIKAIHAKFPAQSVYGFTWSLDTIVSNRFMVIFQRESRTDVEIGDKIKQIDLLNPANRQVVESINLYQSYFTASSGGGIYAPPEYNRSFLEKRLRLDSISFRKIAGNTQTYSFEYNNNGVAKNSLSRDKWGYYSGRANVSGSLIPLHYITSTLTTGLLTLGKEDMYPGAASDIAMYGLKKIKYPTGGETELTYENNDYNMSKSSAYDFSEYKFIESPAVFNNPYKADYPIQVFGNTAKSFPFYIPKTDSITAAGVEVRVEVVANVNDVYYGQTPRYSYTYVKIYDANNVVVYDGDASLGNITRNYFDPAGKQYIIDNYPKLRPGHYRIEYSFDKDWQYIPVFLTIRLSWTRSLTTIAASQKALRGPGLRVKQLTNKTTPTATATTTLYKYNFPDAGKSLYTGNDTVLTNSYGILINKPISITSQIARSCAFAGVPSYSSFANSVAQESTDELGYARIEQLNIGVSDTLRKVSYYYAQPGAIANYDGMFISGLKYINFPLNGQLLREEGYLQGQGAPQYSKTYKYEYEIDHEIWGLKYFRQDGHGNIPEACLTSEQILNMYSYPIMTSGFLKKLEDLDSLRSGTSWLVTKNTYDYYTDNKALLWKKHSFNSALEELVTTYKYPKDYPGLAPYTEMVNRNNIASLIEENAVNVTTSKSLSTTKTNYAFWQGNSLILPASREISIGGSPSTMDIVIDSYDNKGNIQQSTGRDGITTALLWGYNQQYLVAKVTGANHSTVSGLISQGILDNKTGQYTDQQLRTELNKIRTGLTSVNANVSTFTCAPLVGLTSETDTRGQTVFYEYDSVGRLVRKRDNDNYIVKQYEYQYRTSPRFFNVDTSKIFVRNNCAAGQIGEAVVYRVAADTYSSTISQADANQQAMNDINTNGQAYANANGRCYYVNAADSGTYFRNDCSGDAEATAVVYTVPAGTYMSYISQEDANQQAANDLIANGQNYANQNGLCKWKVKVTGGPAAMNPTLFFSIDGSSPIVIPVTTTTITMATLAPGTHSFRFLCTSNRSVNFSVNGTTYYPGNSFSLNVNGAVNISLNTCTNSSGQPINCYSSTEGCYFNAAKSANYTRNNCPSGQAGSTVSYSVPEGKYYSSISPEDANQQAQNDLNQNGQNYANTNGTCFPVGNTVQVTNNRSVVIPIVIDGVTYNCGAGTTTLPITLSTGNHNFQFPCSSGGASGLQYRINGVTVSCGSTVTRNITSSIAILIL